MREVVIIGLTQLRKSLSDRGVLLNIVVIPAVMIVFLGGAFGGAAVPTGQIIDVVRASANDPFAVKFVDLLRAEGQQQYEGKPRFVVCDLAAPADDPTDCKLGDQNTAEDLTTFTKGRINDGLVKASLVLPSTFGTDLQSGKHVDVTLIAKGGITGAQGIQQEVDAINARLSGSILAARVVTEKTNGDSAFFDKVYAAADSIWAKAPVEVDESFSTVTGTQAGTGFGQSAPGIGAMWVLTIALILAEVFIEERKQGTLQRLLILPLSRSQILLGKLLGQYSLGLVTFSVMLGVGSLFGVKWGDPLGVIATVLVYTLAVTAMGLWFSTVARTQGQANGLRQLATMTLAPLGGAWWTLAIVPAWMRTLGQISPIYWSQDAFTKMVFYGAGLGDILPSLAVLLVFAAVFFALGLRRFRYE